jgi:hypothetical protein
VEPIEVTLSRRYVLRLSEVEIGNMPAVLLAMVHTDETGEENIRGSFRLQRDKVTEVMHALAMFR